MIILGYIVFVLLIIRLLISAINLYIYFAIKESKTNYNDLVSVLIPARDEEKNIGNLLSDLLKQNYSNIEIIVYNDLSTDNTAQIVNSFIKFDNRVSLLDSTGLEQGWLGKNYACKNLSAAAKGKYLLFLDSDVRIGENIIGDTLNYLTRNGVKMLSIFPKQTMMSIGEWLVVPIMNQILLSLLPLILVMRSKRSSLAAANGQFMLFEREQYVKIDPHSYVKKSAVEDIMIARLYKNNGVPIACLTGNNEISCKMYNNFEGALSGFSKNILHFFGDSLFAAILYWFITAFGFIPIIISLSNLFINIFFGLVVLNIIFIAITSRQNILISLLLYIPQQIIVGYLIIKAYISRHNKIYLWKGRNIY